MTSEFDLIARHFTRPTPSADLGIGDDAALLRVAPGHQLVVSCDMLVAGTHFLADAAPEALGWKTIAVSVSDLAAMSAQPRWATLALSLPAADEAWIAALASGVHACCAVFGIDLVGGDTTRGPLNLCATLFGEVPLGRATTRDGARPGDDLWVSGQPGRAALGLAHLLEGRSLAADHSGDCLEALHRPQPRLGLGLALRGVASAMLDVSDGITGDLRHILERSSVGAELDEGLLPLDGLVAACGDPSRALAAFLGGGDDYELLFTASPDERRQIAEIATRCGVPVHRLGRVTARAGRLQLRRQGDHVEALDANGYDHFRTVDSRSA
ncbi:MAG: thiamine-phosphate kinase [Rhodocyclaceae bacterium]|nr:thiamine-phosphate kinase [Rhodocyclaceae bacterium]